MREGKVGVRYVMDGEVRWTPVVRRRKTSARSESGDSSYLDIVGEKQVEYRCFGIPAVYIHGEESQS